MSDSKDEQNRGFFNNPTRRVGNGSNDATRQVGNSGPTRKEHNQYKDKQGAPGDSGVLNDADESNPKTRRIRPSSSDKKSLGTEEMTVDNEHPEFVVGWLVVVDGPGKGMSKALGYGMNQIGRESEFGVRLNFGDEEISRNNHCQIAYDHKNKKFYIQHGGGQNLTYLDDQPVLSSCELNNDSIILVGNTSLRFVQLCGSSFDWE